MAAIPRSWKRSKVTFPDPVAQAQVMFSNTPADMIKAYDANQSFLQSCADYKNMMSGIDTSNRRLFQTVTDTLKTTSLPALTMMEDLTKKLPNFPRLPDYQRYDVKPKLTMEATRKYTDMIKANSKNL